MMWFQKQLVALCAAATVAATAFAAPPAKDRIADRPNQVRGDEITPEQQKAVELGLAYLAKQQRADGGFGDAAQPNVAITALSGLAFMQNGNLPGRGRYGENVTRAVDFVLNSCQESGLIAADQMQGPMYGHGFAALFLGEVYGMTGDERVKEKLQRAIRLIQKTQNREGGWRYQPAPPASGLAGGFHAVLQGTDFVMAFADRLEGTLDRRTAVAIQVAVVERLFELGL